MPLNLTPLYERDVPSMSKVNSLKNGKTDFNAFFKIVPFALLRSR